MSCNKFTNLLLSNLKSINYKLMFTLNLVVYILPNLMQVHTDNTSKIAIEILGGLPLGQTSINIYTLRWLVPKLLLVYIISIFISEVIWKRLTSVIPRVGSKKRWNFANTITILLIVFIWNLLGYFIVLFICSFKYGFINVASLELTYVFFMDFLSSFLILNIQYMCSLTVSNSNVGAILSIMIYILAIFINKGNVLLELLPSSKGMYLRQENLYGTLLYLIILLTISLIIEKTILCNKEVKFET